MRHKNHLSLILGILLPILLASLADAGYLPEYASEFSASSASSKLTKNSDSDMIATSLLFRVSKVVDGDTVDLSQGSTTIRVRLIGINSPESVDPRRPVQCFGKEASVHAHTLLDNTSVSIKIDPSQGTLDKYGRTLAYVILPDGQNFNELMIREGYAYEYTYRSAYVYQKIFKEAEVYARTHELGLWASTTCAGKTGLKSK